MDNEDREPDGLGQEGTGSGTTRRRFLQNAAAVALPWAAVSCGLGGSSGPDEAEASPEEDPEGTAESSRKFEISLAQWSLHRRLLGRVEPGLDGLDFAKTARSLGIDAIEYVNVFFFDKAEDASYLRELGRRASDEGVRNLLIMVDREGNLGDPDEAARAEAIERHRKWIAAAATLGCHAIRVNASSRGTWAEQRDLAADGLSRLADVGAEAGIDVIVENHGGLSSSGKWLVEVMRAADHPRLGTLPDFGNFRIGDGETYDRYLGVEELMPFARAVSAKSYAFDAAGNETTIDYERMLKIVTAAGYHGHVGIEYEGSDPDEIAGIEATKRLLERVRERMG